MIAYLRRQSVQKFEAEHGCHEIATARSGLVLRCCGLQESRQVLSEPSHSRKPRIAIFSLAGRTFSHTPNQILEESSFTDCFRKLIDAFYMSPRISHWALHPWFHRDEHLDMVPGVPGSMANDGSDTTPIFPIGNTGRGPEKTAKVNGRWISGDETA